MPDKNTKPGPADRARIDVQVEDDLIHWSRKLGVTRWEVKAAVRKVGPRPEAVARALGSSTRH